MAIVAQGEKSLSLPCTWVSASEKDTSARCWTSFSVQTLPALIHCQQVVPILFMFLLLLREITSTQLGRNPMSLNPCWFLCPMDGNHMSVILFLPTGDRTVSGDLFSGDPTPALHGEAQLEGADFPAGSYPLNWSLLLRKHDPLHLRKPRVLGCCPTAVPGWPAFPGDVGLIHQPCWRLCTPLFTSEGSRQR